MSLFNRRQYSWLASFMRDELHACAPESRPECVAFIYRLGRALSQDNPYGFDLPRFYRYCDLRESEIPTADAERENV